MHIDHKSNLLKTELEKHKMSLDCLDQVNHKEPALKKVSDNCSECVNNYTEKKQKRDFKKKKYVRIGKDQYLMQLRRR